MKKKKTSIKDIAKALKVSITTISFVLNGKGEERKISKEVIKKIEDYAEAVNYRPNQIAQSLRTGKSKILVFMVEDIGNPFFARIARIIEDIAYKKDYKVLFCSNENNDKRSRELIQIFHERQVDGFLIIPSAGIKNEIENLMKSDGPVVLGDRYFEDLPAHHVIINNYEASKEATRHLIDNKYKKIAYITVDTRQIQMLDRERGYKDAMKDAGLENTILAMPYNAINKQEGNDLLKKLIKNTEDIDALFFSTNYLTQSALELIKDENPQLINTIGLLTFDDNEFFKINTPSISAVAQPLQEMAEELMRIMFTLLQTKEDNVPLMQTVLKATLIVRDSSQSKN